MSALRAGGLAALALAATLSGCSRHASAADCTALLDRYVEMLVRERYPSAGSEEITRQQESTRAKAATEASFASCPHEVTKDALVCALAAPNVDEFEKCLE